MASVVLGPGSIVSASRAGAEAGYGLLWILVVSGVMMAVYTSMGARLGCALDTTPLDYLARKHGRWLAVLTGLSGFMVAAGFQFGNNLGVALALGGIIGPSVPAWVWPVLFTTLSIVFLFSAKHVYAILEKVMMVMVAVMMVSFVANLFWTGVSGRSLLAGLAPSRGDLDFVFGDNAKIGCAMLATTFSVVGAFYQAYLVRAKGWGKEDVKNAVGDAWAGIAVLGFMSAVIMMGAAETLFGTGATFGNIGELAQQLKGSLGPASNIVFCCGLAAAAFSSFIVNALVGGGLLADGLGMDSRVDSMGTKVMATAGLVVGCLVAIVTLQWGTGAQTTSVLLAQASTLLAVPLCAILLLVLTSNRNVMGDLRSKTPTIIVGSVGFLILLGLAGRTFMGLAAKLGQ
jgi:manganese transport protein